MFIFTIETVLALVVVALFILVHGYHGVKKYFKQRGFGNKKD